MFISVIYGNYSIGWTTLNPTNMPTSMPVNSTDDGDMVDDTDDASSIIKNDLINVLIINALIIWICGIFYSLCL